MNIVKLRTTVLTLGALAIACEPSGRPTAVDPVAGGLLTDAEAGDAPAWSAWSAPVNLGPVVNSPYNDNSPAISKDGLSLYITSSPPAPRPGGGGGAADMFVSRRHDKRDDFGWEPAENRGCVVNSPVADNGPTIFEDDATGVTTLYFNSLRPGGLGDVDIYASTLQADGTFGAGVKVSELNSPFTDDRVSISRDGLEIFVSTNRPGGVGSQDIWVATRATTLDPWSPPVPLGPVVNSPYFDGGPALSFDGTELYFFSERPGGFGGRDLYVSTRQRINASASNPLNQERSSRTLSGGGR